MRLPGRRPIVVFVDSSWPCFLMLAAALRRAGARTVSVQALPGRLQHAIGRVGYGTTLRVDRDRDLRRLRRWARRGLIVDLQLAETATEELLRDSRLRAALEHSGVRGAREHWELLDKLEVGRRLAEAGLPVPRTVGVPIGIDPSAVPSLAEQLGYPVVVKRRISTGGLGVEIAPDRAAVAAAAARFGTGEPGLLLQEFIRGELVQYGEVHDQDAGAGRQPVCVVAAKPAARPLGPSIAVTLLEDQDFAALGREVMKALAPYGLANMEFVRDRAGRCFAIDLSTRAWGNIAALSLAGADLIGPYLDWLGLPRAARWQSGRVTPAGGTTVRIFPAKVHEASSERTWMRFAWEFVGELAPYASRFGPRFAIAELLSEWAWLRDRLYERRMARAAPAPAEAPSAPAPPVAGTLARR